VPFVEALKLGQALPMTQVGALLVTDLFQHARPRGGLSWRTFREGLGLYRFTFTVLAYM
jgi:hypothetical protein